MGAWIETQKYALLGQGVSSHPVWVRGLKQLQSQHEINQRQVAPRVGAWIETDYKSQIEAHFKSHPVWVRGLKQSATPNNVSAPASHPVWVRGLKPAERGYNYHCVASHPVWVRGLKRKIVLFLITNEHVAPRVGAWIETHCEKR